MPLWSSAESSVWQQQLDSYNDAVASKGNDRLTELDRRVPLLHPPLPLPLPQDGTANSSDRCPCYSWFHEELPDTLRSREPAHMTQNPELVQLVRAAAPATATATTVFSAAPDNNHRCPALDRPCMGFIPTAAVIWMRRSSGSCCVERRGLACWTMLAPPTRRRCAPPRRLRLRCWARSRRRGGCRPTQSSQKR